MGVTIGYGGNTIASLSASGSKTLLTAGKYCEGDISIAYQAESTPNYRKYTGVIDTDIVGTGTKALLVTSDAVASHYSDASFKVAVYFTPSPEVPYAVLQVTGYNTANREPYRSTNSLSSMQYTYREGSTIGSFSTNAIDLAVSNAVDDNYVGRIICDSQGHVYVMSGSANYGIRAGSYVVEIAW